MIYNNLNFINIKTYGRRTKYYSNYTFINSTGRLFGVTETNNDYLIIKVAEDNGRKIISVKKSDSSDPNAVKSSAPSTGKPFINMQSVCRHWFGQDEKQWKHTLIYIKTEDGTDYYEVLEKEGD
ncbi:hypothetical protein IKG31_01290 [Candidatus Saccharibacteria bacterium]|nr:hypothetical protein [Candidatus Saccharibacteria bacterium]